MVVEVVERDGPALAVLVQELDGDRRGWVAERSVKPS